MRAPTFSRMAAAGIRSRHQRAKADRGSARGIRRAPRQLGRFHRRGDPAGKPIYLNAAGRRDDRLAPDFPVEDLQIQDCYPPEIRSFVTDVLLKTMVERGVWSGETLFQNFETHERIHVSDTHFLIRDGSGERVLGTGTVTRDISEARRHADERERLLAAEQAARRQLEAAIAQLRESEERFRLTIDKRRSVWRSSRSTARSLVSIACFVRLPATRRRSLRS